MVEHALILAAQQKLMAEDKPKNIRLLAFQAMRCIPAKRVQPILDGLRAGMTRRQAAGLAGMSLKELNFVMNLGKSGHPAWIEFVDAIRIADSQSVRPTMTKLQSQSEDGDKSAREVFLKAKDPDFAESQEKSSGQGMNVGGIMINVNKRFDPTEEADPIDTSFEEIDE